MDELKLSQLYPEMYPKPSTEYEPPQRTYPDEECN